MTLQKNPVLNPVSALRGIFSNQTVVFIFGCLITGIRQLLDIMRHAIQLPLLIHLVFSAQRPVQLVCVRTWLFVIRLYHE